MTTFDDYIVGLYEKGLITEETAMAYASRKGIVGRGIDTVKAPGANPPPISTVKSITSIEKAHSAKRLLRNATHCKAFALKRGDREDGGCLRILPGPLQCP